MTPEPRFFDSLKAGARAEWDAYTTHPFVEQLAVGSLPEACFRHYLVQDYLFLIHFVRAYGLAIYKADTLADMHAAKDSISAILDVEMDLHVRLCAGWGIDREALEASAESPATIAYTRFVLERGMSGDLLDLAVALSPCVVGYGEIARRLVAAPTTVKDGNPYWPWLEEYACTAYADVAEKAIAQLDRLAERRLTQDRFALLVRTFRQATRLEADFWQMGLTRA